MSTINMDRIVDELRELGIDAYVENTGGGCATIFAGPTWNDPRYGGQRQAIMAGPGYFQQDGDTEGDTEDFSIGMDDEQYPLGVDVSKLGEVTEADIARHIADCVRASIAVVRLLAAEAGSVRGDVHALDRLGITERPIAERMLAEVRDPRGDYLDTYAEFDGWDLRDRDQRDGQEMTLPVSVPNPDDAFAMPIYEGPLGEMHTRVAPGVYYGRCDHLAMPVKVFVAAGTSGLHPDSLPRDEGNGCANCGRDLGDHQADEVRTCEREHLGHLANA